MADADQPIEPAKELDENWREGLLSRIRIVAFLIMGLGGTAVIAGAGTDALRYFGISLLALAIFLIVFLTAKTFSYKVRAIVAVATMGWAGITAYLLIGFLPGGPMTVAYVLFMAALTLGRKAFLGILLAFSAFVFALSVSVAFDVWPGPAPVDIDPENPVTWYRSSVVSVTFWASIGFSVLFVVGAVERNLERRNRALVEKEDALVLLRQQVDERKKAERARREAEAAALQSQKIEAIGQLAAGVAHDFNNALLVVQGWNEIRSESGDEKEQREATAAIEQASEQAAQLARQLLTFARKGMRNPKYIDVDQSVASTVKTLERLVGADISLHVETRSDALAFADESQLQQIFFNLVINARDALPDGGTIRVRSAPASAEQAESLEGDADFGWVVIEVEDDGIGMDQGTLDRVFEPFFTTKKHGQGTGLGLATVLGIVQQHGGHVRPSSRPDEGSRFSIFLPAVEGEPVDLDVPAEVVSGSLQHKRAFVVEDDALARKLIVKSLERAGVDVTACADGTSAIETLKNDPSSFDLLCTDAVFPGRPLAEILELFAEHSPLGSVLICSGYVPEELAIRGIESGEFEFLGKPFTGSRLIAKLRSMNLGTSA